MRWHELTVIGVCHLTCFVIDWIFIRYEIQLPYIVTIWWHVNYCNFVKKPKFSSYIQLKMLTSIFHCSELSLVCSVCTVLSVSVATCVSCSFLLFTYDTRHMFMCHNWPNDWSPDYTTSSCTDLLSNILPSEIVLTVGCAGLMPHYQVGRQHDAHEFLISAITQLECDSG